MNFKPSIYKHNKEFGSVLNHCINQNKPRRQRIVNSVVRRQRNEEDVEFKNALRQSFAEQKTHINPADDRVINSLPSEREKLIKCSICLEENTEDYVKTMPCFHKFHTTCLENWLKIKNECPECRHKI
jgi:hypothetical protein